MTEREGKPLILTAQVAETLLAEAGVRGPVTVSVVREHNHVWRLEAGPEGAGLQRQVFFLKTHTKSWYAGNPDAPSHCVAHEVSAWQALAARGLPVPEVVLAPRDGANAFGRPFLLTRGLAGAPLTRAASAEDPVGLGGALRVVGEYLGRMHAITFAYPGYIMRPEGPLRPPNPDGWQHTIWSAAVRQRRALETWEAHQALLPPALAAAQRERLEGMAELLGPCYKPPRFVHGDCHAHQFFVFAPEASGGQSGEWRVEGVLDIEVASAGDAVQDLLKLGIELGAVLPGGSRWWEPLFEGYGREPDFERYRLRLLGSSPAEFAWLRPPADRRTWETIVRHVLEARDWAALFGDGW